MDIPSSQHYISLCSGGGGLDLGIARALGGARCVVYVENEVTAVERLVCAIEEGRLDDAPVWTDLRSFDGGSWRGRVEGVIAGIPCQPHSYAGRGLGADDPRDLWPVTRELLRDLGPGWFFLENVPGILPYYHARIRPDLQAMGYRVAEALVTAAEVGASHKRERLFVLADSDLAGLEGRSGPIGSGGEQLTAWAGCATLGRFPPGPGDLAAWAYILLTRPDLAPALPAEPGFRRMAHELASGLGECLCNRSDELRILGNGVVPAQAEAAFRMLAGELGQ